MQFVINKDIFTRKGKRLVWLERGVYPVVRMFDRTRVMIDCSTINTPSRQITIVDLRQGKLMQDGTVDYS